MAEIPTGVGYIKTIPFFLKIGAFVILLIALCTLGLFLDKADIEIFLHNNDDVFDHWGRKGGLDFAMFAIVVSWLIVILMVALFLTGLHKKVTMINWPLTVAINMVIWAVLLFISACIIADTVRYYDNEKKKTGYTMCHWLAHYIDRSNARCGHLIGATVTCFIASIIFGIDAFFNFQLFRGRETPSAGPPAVPT